MKLTKNQQAFFALVKAGLWEQEVRLSQYNDIDYDALMLLAEEQSVDGLITAGLERVVDDNISQDVLLQFIGTSLQIEQQNQAMNEFVERLIKKLRKENVYAILVKGQGIAQCYEKPLWRPSGDVDLLLNDINYMRAAEYLSSVASSVDEESQYNQHIAMTIDGWLVELHGTLRSGLWRRIDNALDKVQNVVFNEVKVRPWLNGRTQVLLLNADEDVVFVFSHILQHFYKEGIGLRQICDWCRLLWRYRSELDLRLLESRIREMGVMTEWKAFGALAVDYLGMPVEAMPFYSPEKKWKHKADKIVAFVLETGNFGQNRDYSYYEKYPYVVFKAISLWRHIKDFGRYFVIFPLDSIKVTWRRTCEGFSVAIRGVGHD